ncbi:SpvB/TcaC N-terminal domain-containing protein [Micromonospora sp. NPDC023814]|uniref:SpvB/TcaC N-terminal domain-containing protein n=1 Tax=Micromonospora sp. NPDC023814 TaxID=3154596 RepID=UPI0034113939
MTAPQTPKTDVKVSAPAVSLPTGGGAIRGMGETFTMNAVTGTASFTVPIASSPGRAGFGPDLALSYDSGEGNGPFGLGWSLSLPSITRKTGKGLPRYDDTTDVFVFWNSDDLVPELGADGQRRTQPVDGHTVQRYFPRIEGMFTRIERWTEDRTGDVHWRTTTRDNILSIYGGSPDSRIADRLGRIFSWLLCEVRDDRGQAMLYSYLADDSTGVAVNQAHEQQRGGPDSESRRTNRYLKRVRYGNLTSLLGRDGRRPRFLEPAAVEGTDWMFDVVFDYGDHDAAVPVPEPTPGAWPCRPDPFSTYRPGFEVRTYRLCRRVLMFHHFPGEPDVGRNCLVKSTDLSYTGTVYSMLSRVQHTCYRRAGAGYDSASLPPLDFEYRAAAVDPTVHEITDLPTGVDEDVYLWADLDGEGLPGVLTEQTGAWFYHRNTSRVGQPAFSGAEMVWRVPSHSSTADQQLLDLAGDGQLDLVDLKGPTPGFYERTTDQDWMPWRPFTALPQIDWTDPRLRFIDLTGDGHADIMIAGDDTLIWHASDGESGFGPARFAGGMFDEDTGPRPLLTDPAESIYLADLSGDGLTDVVRVRNGEICYWPNLGYGRFGSKVVMDDAPVFDSFDARRIRLADIDGSGTTDVLYLGADGVQIHLNRSGNSWVADDSLASVGVTDDATTVSVVDLAGSGTSCLVWSPKFDGSLRYVDLMSAGKPHLLTGIRNNLGLTTTIDYTPSTEFFLADQAAGTPWATRTPFPVHCVSKVVVADKWRGTRFASSYSYHHGHYDGLEREFRGFGRVEQVDVESFGEFAEGNFESPYITDDLTLYQPPVKKVSWFHTGADVDFRTEYRHPDGDRAVPAVALLGDLGADDWRQAMRTAKGTLLREELYELEVDEANAGRHVPTRLFSTVTHSWEVCRLQSSGTNLHGVFLPIPVESITAHYELDLRAVGVPVDPRVLHTLTVRADKFGNPLQTVTVGYPRRGQFTDDALDEVTIARVRRTQHELHVSYTENRYTNDVDTLGDDYRLRVPCETLRYELSGLAPEDGAMFTRDELRKTPLSRVHQQNGTEVDEVGYHQNADASSPRKRLLEHRRTLFTDDAVATFDRPAAWRALPRMGLIYESYQLAFTDDLLSAVFGDRLTPEIRTALGDRVRSGYLTGSPLAASFPGDPTAGQYWLRSGSVGFGDDPAGHFFRPRRYTDAFGAVTRQEFDNPVLLLRSDTDPRGNTTTVERFDYRVLAAAELRDPNDNRSQLAFDVLGVPTALAVLGKGTEADDLDGLDEPTVSERAEFFDQAHLDDARARQWLGNATARYVYNLGTQTSADGTVSWENAPACACTIRRERHVRSLEDGQLSPLQVGFEYSDATGAPLMRKAQAAQEAPGHPLRWIADGLTVANNKGNTVKQYEPFFSPPDLGHRFAHSAPVGLATITYYDAVDRPVRVEMPDKTLRRVEFSPWEVRRFDQNDTVKESRWFTERTAPGASPQDARAARLAAEHADTPAVAVLDTLGREVVAIAHNRVVDGAANSRDEKLATLTVYDANDRPLWTRDARGNLVVQFINPVKPTRLSDEPVLALAEAVPDSSAPGYDMVGNALTEYSPDGGGRWRLPDAAGQNIFAWDDVEVSGAPVRRLHSTDYDSLRRPVAHWLTVGGGGPVMVDRFEYIDADDNVAGTKARNMCKRLRTQFDQSGLTTTVAADLGGNVTEVRRRLIRDHRRRTTDWQDDPLKQLESDEYVQMSTYDALNRVIRHYNWHQGVGSRVSVHEPRYDAGGLLTATDVVIRATKTADGHTDSVATQSRTVITSITYDAMGRRRSIAYGNGTITLFDVDPAAHRLRQQRTTRPGFSSTFPNTRGQLRDARVVQNLHYTYDAVGNLVEVHDDAYAPAFFDNQRVEARSSYTYDPLYRLASATGRENGVATTPPEQFETLPFAVDFPVVAPDTLRNYAQDFTYDAAGNLTLIRHQAGPSGSWTRTMKYLDDSNQLTTAAVGAQQLISFRHDSHGNLLNPSGDSDADQLSWDYRDLLDVYDRGGGGLVFYDYDAGKERTRKVNDDGGEVRWSRTYLGGLEIFRRFVRGILVEEIETIEILDEQRRVMLVEDVLRSDQPQARIGPLYRYQYDNMGSATLELTDNADVLSYEEFYPHGSTAYRAVSKSIKAAAKRYRFLGKERDEESGLNYHGVRYYAPWLARWVSADPAGMAGGLNRYAYAHNNPVELKDENGRWPKFVDSFRQDPLGATKQIAQTTGKMALAYAEKRIADLDDKAQMLNPLTATVKIGAGVVAKGVQEAKEIKHEYAEGGGGTRGAARATVRALAGPVSSHTSDAMVKAHKAGASPAKVIDAGLAKWAEEVNDANPLYHLGVATVGAPVAAMDALDRGDPTAAGKHLAEGQSSMEEAAKTLLPMAMEAGLVNTAPRGAMTGPKAPAKPGALSYSPEPMPHDVEAAVRKTMQKLEIPTRNQGSLRAGKKGLVYERHDNMGIGRNSRKGISIDAGILRNWPTDWAEWNAASLETRIEAVLQHEWYEFKGASHEEAIAMGHRGEFTLRNLSEEAKQLLRSMPTKNAHR